MPWVQHLYLKHMHIQSAYQALPCMQAEAPAAVFVSCERTCDLVHALSLALRPIRGDGSRGPGVRAQVRPSAQQRLRLKQLHWDKLREARAGTVWARGATRAPNLDFSELESLFQVLHPCCCPPVCMTCTAGLPVGGRMKPVLRACQAGPRHGACKSRRESPHACMPLP